MPSNRHCLGVHIGHDRGAAVVSDGILKSCIAEERLDRRKHSASPELPVLSIRAVLEIAGIQATELAGIGISYTNVRIDDIIEQLADEIREFLGLRETPVIGVGHHDCHAWSAWCTSGKQRSLVLVADGSGDIVGHQIEAESLYEGSGSELKLIERRLQDFGLTRTDRRNAFNPAYMHELDRTKAISLGRKYEQFTYLIGFHHDESGKTMALAAYSDPLFRLSPPAFEGINFPLSFSDGIDQVINACKSSPQPWHRFIKERAAAIASAAQSLLEDYMVSCLNGINPHGSHDTLCAAGGVFLNCKMNHELLKRSQFERLHVFPAAGDDGQCVGAAFFAYDRICEPPKCRTLRNAFLGIEHGEPEIRQSLAHFKLSAKKLDRDWLITRLAMDLDNGRIVGLLRGRSEIGPRALCHRSILADPRREGIRDCLNRIKGRELFRPFAPVVTAEDQFTYFDLKQESPFMLFATNPKAGSGERLAGILHVDGTSRVQAVESQEEPFIHALLQAFRERTGYPVLLNTSFNLAGDPIVETPHDAIVTFLSSELDVLVLDDYYVDSKVPMLIPF